MSPRPIPARESAVRAAVERLARLEPGAHLAVSCYLKLEPRDKTRGKYLIKMKNRVRDAVAALERDRLERAVREAVAGEFHPGPPAPPPPVARHPAPNSPAPQS